MVTHQHQGYLGSLPGLSLESQSLGTGKLLRPWEGEGSTRKWGHLRPRSLLGERWALQDLPVWFPKTPEPLPTPTSHLTKQLAHGLLLPPQTHVEEPLSAHLLHQQGRTAGRTTLLNREGEAGQKIPSGQI